jgi:hypothetical protein
MSETSDNAGKPKFHYPPLQPTWIIDRVNRHNFEGGPLKDYLDQI